MANRQNRPRAVFLCLQVLFITDLKYAKGYSFLKCKKSLQYKNVFFMKML